MVKTIGALSVLVLALLAAGSAHASGPSLARAESTTLASAYTSIWHKPHKGYDMTTRSQHEDVLPVRSRLVRACDGSQLCKSAIVDYYRELRHDWHSLNRSLYVMASTFPVCASDDATDCRPVAKDNLTVVDFHGVEYVAHQKRLTAP
jgi:hypothetical protein